MDSKINKIDKNKIKKNYERYKKEMEAINCMIEDELMQICWKGKTDWITMWNYYGMSIEKVHGGKHLLKFV